MNIIMLLAALCGVIALGLGAGLWFALAEARRERVRADALSVQLNQALVRVAEAEIKARSVEDVSTSMGQAFQALSAQSLAAAQDELIKRADEQAKAREQLARSELEKQLKPVAETLAKFEAQVTAIEKSRAEDQGGLNAQIKALMQASMDTQAEARKLSSALRRGAGVQGRWGEQALRNVLEAAGLNARFDFHEQFSVDTEEGRRRPDVKVQLPGGGIFVIDAKCSMTAFLEAQETTDDTARQAAMARHAASVRQHVQGLSGKAYWDQFKTERTPDFVAMFVMGDGFLAAALEQAPDLLSEAMDRRVIIVTPTTLFALCKAVAYGWRVEAQAQNADEVAKLGRDLYARISVMGGHVSALGEGLRRAVAKYNDFVGSLESQVLTQAKKFEALSVDHEGKSIPVLEPVDGALRPLSKLASPDSPADRSLTS
jgi:DNA recombination protein RmuC